MQENNNVTNVEIIFDETDKKDLKAEDLIIISPKQGNTIVEIVDYDGKGTLVILHGWSGKTSLDELPEKVYRMRKNS